MSAAPGSWSPGTSSGAGKTTVATGLMAALAARGERAAGFKVGPGLHRPELPRARHRPAGAQPRRVPLGPGADRPAVPPRRAGADMAVVEGVMGLFDGASGRGELASTAHVAKLLRAPVVLVVDAAAMARSVAAIVHGYATFDPDVDVAGVVLNRVGSPCARGAAARRARAARRAGARRAARAMPRSRRPSATSASSPWPSASRAGPRGRSARSAAAIAAELRPRGRAALARARRTAAGRRRGRRTGRAAGGRRPVARSPRGPAFSFHYEENLELLRAAGRRARRPSTRSTDAALPAGTGALLLAGGFPEVFGEELSANAPLRAEIAAFARSGRPVLAECGGLLYLAASSTAGRCAACSPSPRRMTERLCARLPRGDARRRPSRLARGHGGARPRVPLLARRAGRPAAAPAWRLRARGASARRPRRRRRPRRYLHTHWAATPEVARAAGRAAARMRRSCGHDAPARSSASASGRAIRSTSRSRRCARCARPTASSSPRPTRAGAAAPRRSSPRTSRRADRAADASR